MTIDAQLQFLNLLYALSQDPRIEQYQGGHLNADGSLLIIHRWGGRYFETVADLVAWLGESAIPARPAGGRNPQSQIQNSPEPIHDTLNAA